jgi:hypothetical protein
LVYEIRKEIEQSRATSLEELAGKSNYAYEVPATHSEVKGQFKKKQCKV